MRKFGLTVSVFFVVSGFMSLAAVAADLNAPATKKITIGSEIKRGQDAAFKCLMDDHNKIYWNRFSNCIDNVASGNNMPTPTQMHS